MRCDGLPDEGRHAAMPSVRRAALGLLLSAVSVPAWAQDYSPMADIAVARGTTTSQAAATTDVFRDAYGNGSHASGRGRPARPSPPAVPLPTALAKLSYRPSAQASRTALDAYLDRLGKTNPSAAAAAGPQMRQHDLTQIYLGIVGPLGLHDGSVADAYAAYDLLGWTIVNGAPDPDAPQVKGVRDQLAPALAASPGVTRNTTALGEELKIRFVMLFTAWQGARREGTLPQLAQKVDAMFQKDGLSLRGLKLTQAGFHP
jgi:hypothetical protein